VNRGEDIACRGGGDTSRGGDDDTSRGGDGASKGNGVTCLEVAVGELELQLELPLSLSSLFVLGFWVACCAWAS
jgi:hypothetical protein